jgi:hypothetical protein
MMSFHSGRCIRLVLVLCAVTLPVAAADSPGAAASALEKLPLALVPARDGGYTATLPGREVRIGETGFAMTFDRGVPVTFTLGNRRAVLDPEAKLPGVVHEYTGAPSDWRTNVPTFARVRARGIYPGIDVVYYGRYGQLEYDLVVAPGADPSRIRLTIAGATTTLTRGGDLHVTSPSDDFTMQHPVAYQIIDGRRVPVRARFVRTPNDVRIVVGAYDRTREMVIDPTITFSTFLLGGTSSSVNGVALDPGGNMYAAAQALCGLDRGADTKVFKINAAATALVYTVTLDNGRADACATGIAADSAGNAYVVGNLDEVSGGLGGGYPFPRVNAFRSIGAPSYDAFLVKLDPAGHIVYSTFVGGSDGANFADSVATDAAGNAYVVGTTASTKSSIGQSVPVVRRRLRDEVRA